jgi:NAD(P)-dependent dehydrogenase (short-subunit alcohol dehydrogenase family)
VSKIVLITGANKGIGFEVARQLGRSGFTVLLGARDASRGEAAAAKLRAEGSDVRPVTADLGRAHETATALAGKIEKEFGHLDVLVNNAGAFDLTGGDSPASTVSIDSMKLTFDTNFFGTVEFTQPLSAVASRSRERPHHQCLQRPWLHRGQQRSSLAVLCRQAPRL